MTSIDPQKSGYIQNFANLANEFSKVATDDLQKEAAQECVEKIFHELEQIQNNTNDEGLKGRCRDLKEVLQRDFKVTADHPKIDLNNTIRHVKLFSRALAEFNESKEFVKNHLPPPPLMTYKPIANGCKQISVLSQMDDETGLGFQNCGFHSLKNALLLMLPADSQNPNLYTDKNLFKIIYDRYCTPFLEGKNSNERDASMPLLKQIITTMRDDTHAPPELHALISNLKASENSLLLLNMTTSDGTPHGAPVLANIDSGGLIDALKLAEFSKKAPPASLTCIFGSDKSQHWYAIRLDKSEEGNIEAVVCDSISNTHNLMGRSSPAFQMAEIIKGKTQNIEEFLMEATSDIGEEFSRKAAQIIKDDELDEEQYQERIDRNFLDTSPNEFLAVSGLHNGSPKSIVLGNMFNFLEVVKKGNLLENRLYSNNINIKNLYDLLKFYRIHLPDGDPDYDRIVEALEYLEGRIRDPEKIALNDLIAKMGALSLTDPINKGCYESASRTLDYMVKLWDNAGLISDIGHELDQNAAEAARNYKANELLSGGVGIEKGFITGGSAKEAEASLRAKVQSTILVFEKAQSKGKLLELVQALRAGGSCITNQVENIQKFAAQMEEIDLGDENIALVTPFFDEVFSEILLNLFEEIHPEFNYGTDLYKQKSKEFIENFDASSLSSDVSQLFFDEFVRYMKGYERGEPLPFKAAKNYLIREGVIFDEQQEIDWSDVLVKLNRSGKLMIFMRSAKDYAGSLV